MKAGAQARSSRFTPSARIQAEPARPGGSAGLGSAIQRLQRGAGNLVVARALRLSRDTARTRPFASSGLRIARQNLTLGGPQIPDDLRSTLAVHVMSDEDLQRQYDRIVRLRADFTAHSPNESTADTALLDGHIDRLSTELSRRAALAAGRTFSQRAIDQMKAYLVQNAKTEKDSCIVCMNKSIRKVLEDPGQPLTPESVEKTMELMQKSGRASEVRVITFNNARGKVTSGAARPAKLTESVYDAVLEMVGGDAGWSVFGMSLMDGLHSVLLTVDNQDRGRPKVYWSDQWKSKGGWKEYSRPGLDAEIVRLIQAWWDEQAVGKKHTTVVRLWRLRQ